MMEDVVHKGVTYRIISEEANIAHPEGAIVAVFELHKPKGHTKIFEKMCQNHEINEMNESARLYIAGI